MMQFNQNIEVYRKVSTDYYNNPTMLLYPGIERIYYIYPYGGIYNLDRGIFCKPFISSTKILVRLNTTDNELKNFQLKNLIAYQFCNPPYKTLKELEKYKVIHLDNNPFNVLPYNLQWVLKEIPPRFNLNDNYDIFVNAGRPIVDANFVHRVCMMFVEGKSNTQIMNELGMQINNANHTLLRDIRGGYTWKDITSQYDFDRSSKKHAYTAEEKDKIAELMKSGKSVKEIFAIMQGREYVASTDRLDSSYRTIQSIQVKLRKEGYNV